MEKYHIYEEIGKGRFSQIFKGREKKNIEYVAIKRVDKNMMDKVVNEVQIIHRLESPHTIKFHDWYETRNNLWLILEYCAGGDLASLIKQDGHLPETSVRMFSLDILAGLKYLHSIGLLHCDLRPSNILIDEYGILKISDFKYTRKIPKAALHSQPLSSRGTPKHMAPELFSSEGVHSYASDFWSLGCIIFELRCGHHPFSCNSSSSSSATSKKTPGERRAEEEEEDDVLNGIEEADEAGAGGGGAAYKAAVASLLERIRTRDPLVTASPALSPALRDLLAWLLEKIPSFRCDWNQLCSHPFWGQNLPLGPQNLPIQAVYDHFVKNHFEGTVEDEDEVAAIEQPSVSSAEHSCGSRGGNLSSPSATHYQDTPPHQSGRRKGGVAEQTSAPVAERGQGGGGGGDDNREGQRRRQSPPPCLDIASTDILTHISDNLVKPIVNNRAIETIEKHTYTPPTKGSSTHFQPLSLEQLSSLSQAKIESHLSHVYKNLQTNLGLSGSHRNVSTPGAQSQASSPAALVERANILSYLCSLSSNTDAANTVLNTVFVNLLLHILKAPVGTTKTHSQSLKNSATLSPKALAATALALFLRYATYVEPPKALKDKDPPPTLLNVLVTLLRDPSLARQDALLRHRALAALGEIVFYISAQEEDRDAAPPEEDPAERRWALPLAAVVVLTKALSDESDEISRHYAAKTIENVLAQGGYLARRKFCMFEIAFRLLELSQHSRNTSIQTTCAMALFHLFLTVAQKDYNSSSGANTVKKKGKAKPVSEESTVTGSQFIARVLEKSGLVGFIDSLRDGRPRLQQAYLNIFNLVFSPLPLLTFDQKMTGTGTGTDAASRSLGKVRAYFLKAHAQLLPSLCRLAEQGSSAIVRAKAVLALGHVNSSTDLTIALCDQRFHSILMKVVEPVVASADKYVEEEEEDEQEEGQEMDGAPTVARRRRNRGVFGRLQYAFGAQRVSSSSSIYTGQCLLFLLQVLRKQLAGCLLDIIGEQEKEQEEKQVSTGKRDAHNNTPTKRESPGGGSRGPHSSPSLSHQQDERLAATLLRADVLKASMSLCSHASTRRLVAGSPSFLAAVARALRLPALACTASSPNNNSEAKQVAEEAVLLSLEFLSQLGADPHILGSVETGLLLTQVVPAAAQFCGVCSGDSRVVVLSSLRRLLPPLVPSYSGNEQLSSLLADGVLGLLPLHSLLLTGEPVPQYTVRLLTEVMGASEGAAVQVASLLLCGPAGGSREQQSVSTTSMLQLQTLLFSALSGTRSSSSTSSAEDDLPSDTHVALLLTRVLSVSRAPSPLGLLQGAVQLFPAGLADTLRVLTLASVKSKKNIALLGPVLDLLSESLGFLKHALRCVEGGAEEAQREIVQIAVHLASVLPPLLSVLVWSQPPDARIETETGTEVYSLQQSCLQVFALFVDLTPQHLISLLCRDYDHDDDRDSSSSSSASSRGKEGSFCHVFATVLSQGVLEGRLLLKFLGLFLRFVKIVKTTSATLSSSSSQHQQQEQQQRVLRLLSSDPIHSSLLLCRRRDWAATASFAHLGSAREAVDAIHHLSSQLLALSGEVR